MSEQDMRQRVNELIDSSREAMTRTLSELVQIPSVTGEEGAAQEYMQKLYVNPGLKVVTFEPDIEKLRQHKGFSGGMGSGYEGRPNVLGILEGSPSARSLKLNAHIDVVTPEPVDAWAESPWSGRVEGDRVYGRGASDDKSGLIANYFALKSLLDAGIRPEGTVILESSVEEERGGAGALASLIEGYTADGAVYTDSGLGIVVATGGLRRFRVRVKGRPIHAGWAELGVSAILKMNKLVQALAELDEKRGQELHYPLFESGGRQRSCNLNIGIYRGGDYGSTVPGWAEIEGRVGSIPGESNETVRKQVDEAIKRAAEADEWLRENPPDITWTGPGSEPWEQDPDHPFVQTFKRCVEDFLGREVGVTGMSASADARHAGHFGVPALMCGASGANAHATDEWVDMESVLNISKVLAHFIMEWCGVRE